MLPEAVERVGPGNRLSLLLITGFLISFFLERLLWILFRNHHHERDRQEKAGLVANILFGGAVHSFMDGIAIATSFLVGHSIGVATTIAVLLHEVPHHIADVGVLVFSGLTRRRAVLNLVATFGCALGGVLVLVFGTAVNLANNLLPIAAAKFLYVAIGILLPELQREQSGRIGVDGIIDEGSCAINEAPITGESMPVSRTAGDSVYAGTILVSGQIRLRG